MYAPPGPVRPPELPPLLSCLPPPKAVYVLEPIVIVELDPAPPS